MSIPYGMNSCNAQSYAIEILKAEAKIATCLSNLLCDEFVAKIHEVESVEKRADLIKTVVCAYSHKENAMANLVRALSTYITKEKQHHNHNNSNSNVLSIILLIIIFKSCLFCF
ncbi:hypothetical protein [Clostridium algidicarnis]|uniref:hypothetical protein n=1 Tax=Clostridium algidicarnis TaxID=37659 RepID=UPI001C0DA520|nr:hypothetical protein [Clostridium algidicarnis]MBU3192439.1 hypothetical protein [Clostridium algidicarnis]MBU3206459.1 hypothetical protein [Clostridium algidicarnis]